MEGLTENDGHENDGLSKLQGMKLQDMKIQDMKMQDTMSFSNEDTYILTAYAVPVSTRSSAWGLAVQSVAPTFIWLCEFTTDTEH